MSGEGGDGEVKERGMIPSNGIMTPPNPPRAPQERSSLCSATEPLSLGIKRCRNNSRISTGSAQVKLGQEKGGHRSSLAGEKWNNEIKVREKEGEKK